MQVQRGTRWHIATMVLVLASVMACSGATTAPVPPTESTLIRPVPADLKPRPMAPRLPTQG